MFYSEPYVAMIQQILRIKVTGIQINIPPKSCPLHWAVVELVWLVWSSFTGVVTHLQQQNELRKALDGFDHQAVESDSVWTGCLLLLKVICTVTSILSVFIPEFIYSMTKALRISLFLDPNCGILCLWVWGWQIIHSEKTKGTLAFSK